MASTTRSCWFPSAGPRDRRTSCPSWRTSPAAGPCRASGWPRWPATTTGSAGSARSSQQCRDLLAAIEKDFAVSGLDLPLYWGNRNWHPYLADTVAAMAADGVRHALAFVTSAYGSYSSCRQYLDDIEAARARAGRDAPRIDKIRHFFNHPGFIGPFAESTRAAIESLPAAGRPVRTWCSRRTACRSRWRRPAGRPVACTRLSCAEAARLVAGQVAAADGRDRPWRLVYQSRSGAPSIAVARPGRVRPPGRPCPATGRRAPSSSRSASSPTTWRSSSTSTSRPRRRASGSASRWRGPRLRAPHPRFVAMITELVRERSVKRPAAGGAAAWRPARSAPAPGPDIARTHAAALTRLGAAARRPGATARDRHPPGPARPGLCRPPRTQAGMLHARRPPGGAGRPEVAGTKSSPTDVVTEMDRAAEALITRAAAGTRPGDAIPRRGGR